MAMFDKFMTMLHNKYTHQHLSSLTLKDLIIQRIWSGREYLLLHWKF